MKKFVLILIFLFVANVVTAQVASINTGAGGDVVLSGDVAIGDSLSVVGNATIAGELKTNTILIANHAHIEIFSTDSVATTVSSAGSFVNIANTFSSSNVHLFSMLNDTITYTGTDSIIVSIDFSITASSGTANERGIWQLFMNGVSIGTDEGGKSRDFKTANSQGSLSYPMIHELVNGDTMHFRFTDNKASIWGFESIHIRFSEIHRYKRVAGG